MVDTPAELNAARDRLTAVLEGGLFAPLADGLPTSHVSVRSSWADRTITVEWTDGPLIEEVRSVLDRLDVGAAVALEHHAVWSCGVLHRDRESAWLHHEGPGFEGGAAALIAAREDGFSALACRPGEFRICLLCGGRGSTMTRVGAPLRTCSACGGERTFDVSTEEGRAAWRSSARSAAVAAPTTQDALPGP